MKKSIAVIAAVIVLSISGLAWADNGKEMMECKGGMMGGKGMSGMMKMMGMMQQMHSNLVATSDGGVIVAAGGKLIKYDNQLNVVKQIDLPRPEMGMMGKNMGMMDMDNDDDKGSRTNK